MDQKRIDAMLQSAEKQMESAQTVLKALDQQRKGAVANLERKVGQLVEATDKLTKPALEGEGGTATLANTLRELIQSANSTQLALEAHDKLLDMIIRDLIGVVEQVQNLTQGSIQTAMMSQVMLNCLLDKGILTDKELKASHSKVAAQAKENLAQLKRQE